MSSFECRPQEAALVCSEQIICFCFFDSSPSISVPDSSEVSLFLCSLMFPSKHEMSSKNSWIYSAFNLPRTWKWRHNWENSVQVNITWQHQSNQLEVSVRKILSWRLPRITWFGDSVSVNLVGYVEIPIWWCRGSCSCAFYKQYFKLYLNMQTPLLLCYV